MRAVAMLLIGLIAQPLAWPLAASAKVPEGVALLAEVRPELARLTLVWPEPVEATLQVDGAVARLRVGIPLAAYRSTQEGRWHPGSAALPLPRTAARLSSVCSPAYPPA